MRRTLDIRTFWIILVDTGYVTASLILIIASAAMFSRFLAISGLPSALSNWVVAQQFLSCLDYWAQKRWQAGARKM